MKLFLVILSFFICHNIYSFQEALKNSPKTKAIYENFMFSWTAVFGNKAANHYEVDAIHFNGKTRLKLFAVSEKDKLLISTTYITKDKWHVIEDERKAVYRPFEANYKMVKTYHYLMKAKLQFLTLKNLRYLGKYKKKISDSYHFYIPLSQAEKEAIRHQIDRLKNQLIPNTQSRAEEHFYLRQAKELFDYIEKGKLNTVDESGIISRLDTPDGVVEISNLRWATVTDANLLTPQGNFEDLTQEPDWSQVAFFSYNGTWTPGMPTHMKDSRIIDLKSNKVRRLAFKGTISTPQAIDRQKGLLYLTGITPGSHNIKPFVYNLSTNELKLLGPRMLHSGRVEQIALAPDRKKIALIHNPQPHLGNLRQLVILDLHNKKLKTYKTTGNPERICWHPDNQSLYFSHFNPKTKTSIISLFSPGKVTDDLLEGSYPLLSPSGQSLIYLDLKDQLWKKASLKGENSSIYQNGLQKLQFPVWSNQQALFIQQGEEYWPVPVIKNLNSGKVTPLTQQQGLWLNPLW